MLCVVVMILLYIDVMCSRNDTVVYGMSCVVVMILLYIDVMCSRNDTDVYRCHV